MLECRIPKPTREIRKIRKKQQIPPLQYQRCNMRQMYFLSSWEEGAVESNYRSGGVQAKRHSLALYGFRCAL
jgi:hypothetical protein